MFENLFNKKISTKNLYVATLRICVEVEKGLVMRGNKSYDLCKFHSFDYFVFVRKIKEGYKDCYQEIFTKNIYENEPLEFNVDNFYINNLVPFPATTSYITYKEAVNMYKELNNIQDRKKDIEKQNSEKLFQKIKKH